MREMKTTVYTFDELSDRAKETARDWFRQCIESDDIGEPVIEDAKRIGALIGLDLKDVYWLLDVQGAGACFEATYRYRPDSVQNVAADAPSDASDENARVNRIARDLAALQAAHGKRISATCKPGRESHAYGMGIEVYVDGDDAPADVATEVCELIIDFANWIYRGLAAESSYRYSAEAVDEDIRANEYEFTVDGKRTTVIR